MKKLLISALILFTSSISFAHSESQTAIVDYAIYTRLPVAICKFSGTTSIGEFFPTCIGVRSVIKEGQGEYTVNLSEAMDSTNYVIQVVSESTTTNDTNQNSIIQYGEVTTTSFQIKTGNSHGVQGDHTSVHVVVYRAMQ